MRASGGSLRSRALEVAQQTAKSFVAFNITVRLADAVTGYGNDFQSPDFGDTNEFRDKHLFVLPSGASSIQSSPLVCGIGTCTEPARYTSKSRSCSSVNVRSMPSGIIEMFDVRMVSTSFIESRMRAS